MGQNKYPAGAKWDRRLESNAENSFDVIRLILATLVVFEHSYFLPFNNPANEPLYIFSKGQIHFGSFAVNFFFVLSGFLITRSWLLTTKPSRYFQKRVARIVPGFLIASLASIFIGILGSDDPMAFLSGINVRATLAKAFSLHQSAPGGAFQHNPMSVIDGTLWSIRYEFDCYLMVAGLGIVGLLSRIPIGLLLVFFSLTYVAQQAGYLQMPSWSYGPLAILSSNPIEWPRLFMYFLAGSAFYLWRDLMPKSWIICALGFFAVVTGIRFGSAEPVLIIAGTYCILFVALSTAAVPRIRGSRVDLSYGIYLFGFPIQQLIIAWSSQAVTPVWLFVTSFIATCCVAYVSWIFIEAPCLRWVWPTRPELSSKLVFMVKRSKVSTHVGSTFALIGQQLSLGVLRQRAMKQQTIILDREREK